MAGMMAVLLAAGAVSLEAQLGPEAGRVVSLTGRVSLERGGELWTLNSGQMVNAGQVVVTGADGYLQLQLPDRSTIEVFPNSRLIFRANRFNWRDILDLYLGKVRLLIQRLGPDDPPYRLTSPTAVISIRGTALEVEVDLTEQTTIHVETGSVGVRHRLLPGKEVVVESGQTLRVVPNVPLAVAKFATPLAVVGRIVRIAGETLARVDGLGSPPRGGPSGSPGPSASPGASPAPAPSGSDAGSNEPAPTPGQDGPSAPPGDVIP